MFKLAALGALCYAGYRYCQKKRRGVEDPTIREVAVAGGPLSENAVVRHSADGLPA